MKWTHPWWLLPVVFLASPAHAEPWLCTEPDGSKAFSYEPESARKKNCVHRPIPSANVWRVRPRDTAEERPQAFPRVDARVQKERDATRREILARELAAERNALADAMRALTEQRNARAGGGKAASDSDGRLKPYLDRVRLHATNVSNLEKELGLSS
jgi:hypothetical protein